MQVFKQCVDGEPCSINTHPALTNPQVAVSEVSQKEEQMMLISHIMLGTSWWLIAYLPIVFWFAWRRKLTLENKTTNKVYYFTWQFMWMAHYAVFQFPALIFPFTFLGSQTVNHFYMLMIWWMGLIGGGTVASVVVISFVVAIAAHKDLPSLKRAIVATELILYIVFTVGIGVLSYFLLVDKAYAYLELSLPKEKRGYRGITGNHEGSEH